MDKFSRCRRLAVWLVLVAWPASSAVCDPPTAEPGEDYYELFQLFVDSLDQIERNYVQPVDRRELVEAAIDGMLRTLDPYSSYVKPDEVEGFRANVESSFGGIGVQVAVEEGVLKVVSPLVGSPAYRAGVMAADTITQIDGRPTEGITMDQAVEQLKGPVGTRVRLTIRHLDRQTPRTLEVEREIVRVDTVLGDRRGEDDSWEYMFDEDAKIGYVRVTAFGRETSRELRRAVEGLRQRGMRALVLDLRFNPGGLLTAAIEVSDLFLAEGTIVSTTGRNTVERSWQARREETFDDFPIVVLVNRYSASAGEIVAAALQDNGRAMVMGERTWGKGSVQNVIELEGGRSVLKLTTSSYRRPNGHNIHRFTDHGESDRWGVMPDAGYTLRLPPAELATLVRDRRMRDIVQPRDRGTNGEPAEEPAETAIGTRQPVTDRHLQMALDFLGGELARAE